jgi:hypothetical protein
MNYIGIDISINSTAIFIETNGIEKILSFTNKKDNNIYIKELDRSGVNFTYFDRKILKDYTDNELSKMRHYIDISDNVINKILSNIDLTKKTYCQIEGYSFSKNTSSILDIVSLSTLIRSKLLVNIKDIDMKIISPSSLKLEACKMVYKPIDIGKKKPKYEYKNNLGISLSSDCLYFVITLPREGLKCELIYNTLLDHQNNKTTKLWLARDSSQKEIKLNNLLTQLNFSEI